MLSIQWIQEVDYYLNQATADYYFRPGEPPGRWWGAGAKTLNLTGLVEADQLRAVCKGFATDGQALIQNAGAKNHQQAWDLTFSAPKSVSVLWTQAPRGIRLKIRKLHHKAVKTALEYLTDVALLTRRGKGGVILEHALPIVAIFEHGTNRELEPQLHSHCVLVNTAGRVDGTFGTILSEPFYKHKMTAGALYRAQFAHLLRNELGLKIERQDQAFGVAGIPQVLVDHYSTRRKQIEARLGLKGSHSSKAAATAALDTRKAKQDPPPPRGELFRRWQEVNARFGFSEAKVQGLLGKVVADKSPPVLEQRIVRIVDELLEGESYFSEQQLIRAVAIDRVADGVAAGEIINQVRSYLAVDSEILALGAHYGETVFTTRKMWDLEKELLAAVDEGKDNTSHVLKKSFVERILDQELPLSPNLTEDERVRNLEQRNAVLLLTTAPGDVQPLEGMAGAGKTFTLKIVRQVYEAAGYRVIGMAPSAIAAANLQEGAGIQSDTIAMRLLQLDGRQVFARHHKRQLKRLLKGQRTYAYDGRKFSLDEKTIAVFDEAAMGGTKQWAKLVTHTRKAGAKLIPVGDRRQLQPVEAGAPFPRVTKLTGKADLEHVVRQKVEPDDPNPTWHRQAGKLIAAGHAAQAIKLFAERGRLIVLPQRDQAMLSIARDWSVQGVANPRDHIVLAATRAEVAELNTLCQLARINAGSLGTDHCIVSDVKLRVGDVVLFTKNSRLHQVKNGDRGEVLGFNHLKKTMAVRLQTTNKTVYIPYRNYKEIELGYAMTTHKAQGATVPSVYVLLGSSMQDRNLSYVQATRACESTRLYVDRSSAGPQMKALLQQMATARPKLMAHDVASGNPPDVTSSSPPAHGTNAAGEATRPQPATKASELARLLLSLRQKAGKDPDPAKIQTPAPQRRKRKRKNRRRIAQSGPKTDVRPADTSSKSPPTQVTTPSGSGATPTNVGETAPPVVKAAPSLPLHGTEHDRTAPAVQRSLDQNSHTSAKNSGPVPTSPTHPRKQTTKSTRTSSPTPKPTAARGPRDVLDLSHVQAVGTTDEQVLRDAIKKYGKLPGGIVVEGTARCDVQIRSLAIDATRPTHLIVNNELNFDTGLTAEEVALLWRAVLQADTRASNDFGVLSQTTALGIDDDTLVGVNMMKADNSLGGIVYGYDSQFRLCNAAVSSYANPCVAEMQHATAPDFTALLCFNNLYSLHPQLFLSITDAMFSRNGTALVVQSTKVTAALGVLDDNDRVVTSIAHRSSTGPLVAERFPWIHRSFENFVAHFRDFARTDPCIARTVAYAELVLLLRRAKAGNAALIGHDHVRRLLASPQRVTPPRFNYTLRSKEYAALVTKTARSLSANHNPDPFARLMAAVLGHRYATRAGDVNSFTNCKEMAGEFMTEVRLRFRESDPSWQHQELYRLLPVIAAGLESQCHDVLVANCMHASKTARTRDSQTAYLKEAQKHCTSLSDTSQHAATRCRQIEIEARVSSTYGLVDKLAQVRRDHSSSMQPFQVLSRINAAKRENFGSSETTVTVGFVIERRKEQLGHAKLSTAFVDSWKELEGRLSTRAMFDLLQELYRYGISLQSYLLTYRAHSTDDPMGVLTRHIAESLAAREAFYFSESHLTPANPFADCHELLDRESPEELASQFAAIRAKVEVFDSSGNQNQGLMRRFLSKFTAADNPQQWWQEFLRSQPKYQLGFTQQGALNDASKVALLLAHEMSIRGLTVPQLYDIMKRHDTKNPQAALYFFDLESTPAAKVFPAFRYGNREGLSS